MRKSLWLLTILLIVSGCAPDPVAAEADRAELAIADLQEIYERQEMFGDAPEPMLPAGGRIAGMPVYCGKVEGVRALRAGRVTVPEGAVGQDPEVFEELWRRAECGSF